VVIITVFRTGYLIYGDQSISVWRPQFKKQKKKLLPGYFSVPINSLFIVVFLVIQGECRLSQGCRTLSHDWIHFPFLFLGLHLVPQDQGSVCGVLGREETGTWEPIIMTKRHNHVRAGAPNIYHMLHCSISPLCTWSHTVSLALAVPNSQSS
jgi:hypothetical protein